MKRQIVMIGSMDHDDLFVRAALDYPDDDVTWPKRARDGGFDPTNRYIGDWYHRMEAADIICVVRKPDGTLGNGTVDELALAVGVLQQPWRKKRPAIEWAAKVDLRSREECEPPA